MKMQAYCTVKTERNIIHPIKRRKANSIGHILCRNCPVKHVIAGKMRREDEKKDVCSYCMILRKRFQYITGIWKRKH
jgi:hypothetical protein